jgi:hypothetical protein
MDGEIIVISFLNGRYYSATGFAADLLNALSKGPLSKEDAFAWLEKHRGPPEGTGWNLALDVLWERLLTEGMLSCTEAPSVTDNLSRTSLETALYFQAHTELADVITLDPVHEVSSEGWPHKAAT